MPPEHRPPLGQIASDVLARLREGPIHLKAVNRALQIAPTTFKSVVRDLRHAGFDIRAERESGGKGCNVYTLASDAG